MGDLYGLQDPINGLKAWTFLLHSLEFKEYQQQQLLQQQSYQTVTCLCPDPLLPSDQFNELSS